MNRTIHTLSTSRTALILLLATLLTATAAQTAWAAWTGTGSKANPYIISTPEDLLLLAHRVNGTYGETVVENGYLGTYFKLGADITFSHDEYEPSNYAVNYEAIGGSIDGTDRFFKGIFDGDGHTVSGIRIRKTTGITDYQGLFGCIGSGANIHDVHLTDARIKGNDKVGGIAGYNNDAYIVRCSVTDSYITANRNYYGTICGSTSNPSRLTNNYYHGCTVNGTAVTSGVGYNRADLTANNGALPAYRLDLGDGVTIQTTMAADLGFSCDADNNGTAENYWRSGTELTLGYTGTVPAGYLFDGLTATNGTVGGNANDGYTLTMPDQDAAIAAAKTPDPAHFSVNDAGTEYTISTATGWNVFCDLLADNTMGYFSGKTVQLGADITVTRMAGGSNHAFTGTFDGGDHTLTLAYGTADAPIDAQFVAPFVETANDGEHQPTFRNLTIAGTIYDGYTGSEAHNLGGLIGHLFGTVTIEHCTSLVEIHAKVGAGGFVGLCEHSVSFNDCHSAAVIRSADGSNSGFVAWSRASEYTIAFTGCLFDGKLLQQNGSGSLNGGFIGWTGASKTVTFTNSLCAPAPLATGEKMASSGSATFARGWNATTTATNCYDTAAFEIAQGKATRTVAAADDVTIGAIALTGTATQYTVSGITAYSGGGLQHGETLYYGSDDQLSLTLSNSATGAPLGYQYGYTASAGTLSGTTLTMPDADVTISVALAPIDWATVNQGSPKDPYMIYNKDQLLLLAHRVNGTNGETAVINGYYGMSFKLGADITFTHDAVEGDDYAENYEAISGYIGGTYRYFKGVFDGDGHTISGIRIRKTGSGDADSYQGLFGFIDGAQIHDVHLTDARITGYQNVGGIAGYINAGSISGCSVTDSYITSTKDRIYGTICGFTKSYSSLTNNYYHGCTVNGTAVTSGMGCNRADIADNNGALPAYAITLGANITTPPGTFVNQTRWLATPPASARLKAENGFTLAGNHYFASGYVFTPGSTLASGAAQGYTPRATLDGQLLDLYTHTGDAPDYTGTAIAQFTVTADCDGKTLAAALRSDGLQHEVSYMTADGTTDEASAIALDGTETSLAAGTYFAGLPTVQFDHTLTLTGNVTLILADNCHMNVGTSGERINGQGIAHSRFPTLTITSEANGSGNGNGALNIYTTGSGNYGIITGAITINGGNVTADTDGSNAVALYAADTDLTINGGTVTATTTGTGAHAIRAFRNFNYNGGNVTATAAKVYAIMTYGNYTLGWTRPADRITIGATGLFPPGGGTVAVANGKALTDGSGHIYTGTLSAADLAALADETLQPCLVLNETDGVTPLAAFAGQANVPVMFTRPFTSGVASTVCLPFAISADQATAAGKFYSFAGVDTSGNEWVVTMQETNATNTALAANTPYLFMPKQTGAVTFGGTLTVPTSGGFTPVDVTPDVSQYPNATGWTYRGTYETIEWESDPRNIYGFASGQAYGESGDETEAGKFIRVHTGGIRPFRAYLQYSGSGYARALSRSATDGLPETMTVRLIGSNGETTAIGTLDTRTGELDLDADSWYDMNGRRLSGKPSQKGVYINNGKKVIVK